jgi:hypothetical protein
MHAVDVSTEKPSIRIPRWNGGQTNLVLRPEQFRDRVEAEVARHDRYLQPFGLLRIGCRAGRHGVEALREAVSTEIRRTDAACALPDGSCAVLVLHGGLAQLRTVASRLMATVAEMEREQGDEPTALVAALAPVGDRRVEADALWLSLGRAYGRCRSSDETIVAVP